MYDWEAHSPHRQQVVEDTGQWLGLLDENFNCILELPAPSEVTWPTVRGSIESTSITMGVRTPSGRMHRVVQELVAENLGVADLEGRLLPVTGPVRLIRRERKNIDPWTMRITHVEVEGDDQSPHTMKIHGVVMNSYLDLLPCPSNPLSWLGNFTRFTRDWVGEEGEEALFDEPRDLASATMITVADGASVEGQSDAVIHQLISESLDAVHRIAGITTPIYEAVLADQLAPSKRIILRPTDQTLWKELADTALSAGVGIHVELWVPGDPNPSGVEKTLPTIIITTRQEA